ncbi:hypothetical protein RG089_002844 [Elizabethkingia anophelis]|nr:hypothetical protein [Elizabethkingia anophelis]ELB1894337.1 hypothetical protein [Elizabethkingia anophelis]
MKNKETSVQKLCRLIKEKFEINVSAETFNRLYPGYWQRSQGTWTWVMQFTESYISDFGSQHSVKDLIRNWDKVVLYEGNELIIEN